MDGLQKWALTVCAAAVVCTLLRRLFPDTSLGRQGRLLLPCVFLCVLLSPLAHWRGTAALPPMQAAQPVDTAQLRVQMKRQMTDYMNRTLLKMVNQALQNYGWEAQKVEVAMDIRKDGSIDMGQITVYVDEKTARSAAAVRQIAEKRLGTSIVLVCGEESP